MGRPRRTLIPFLIETNVSRQRPDQGKPTVRWRRKARDLRSRPPGCRIDGERLQSAEELDVKPTMERLAWTVAGVARYGWVILILASLALSLGAGLKWDWAD
jgi:hypothetical protein